MTDSSATTARGERTRIRLDRWLWAARFYKTRSLAKTAIDGGKVHVNDARVKAAKGVAVGDTVRITLGAAARTVAVTGLAERRGNATTAATLYAETPASLARRESERAERRALGAGMTPPKRRPDKRQRRRLQALKNASH